MYYRIDIYIGSNNQTKKIDGDYLEKIKKWADSAFTDGYTIFRGEGCYNGVYEDSILLNALTLHDMPLNDSLESLKKDLEQDAILTVKSGVEFELI